VSRGMSHVSEMILATVSKVDDIGNSLKEFGFRQPRRIAQNPTCCLSA
jgi:hypothetical protein